MLSRRTGVPERGLSRSDPNGSLECGRDWAVPSQSVRPHTQMLPRGPRPRGRSVFSAGAWPAWRPGCRGRESAE